MADDLDFSKQFSNGPFTQALQPRYEQLSQPVQTTGWETAAGKVGSVARVANYGSQFLKGLGMGKIQAFAMQEAQRQQKLNAFLKTLELAADSPNATPEQKEQYRMLASQAISRAYLTDKEGQDKGKKGKKGEEPQGPLGKMQGVFDKMAETMAGTRGKGTSDLDWGTMNANFQLINKQPGVKPISESLLTNANRVEADIRSKIPNADSKDILADRRMASTLQQLEHVNPKDSAQFVARLQSSDRSIQEQEYQREQKLLTPPENQPTQTPPGTHLGESTEGGQITGQLTRPSTGPNLADYQKYVGVKDMLGVPDQNVFTAAFMHGKDRALGPYPVIVNGKQTQAWYITGPYGDRQGFYDMSTHEQLRGATMDPKAGKPDSLIHLPQTVKVKDPKTGKVTSEIHDIIYDKDTGEKKDIGLSRSQPHQLVGRGTGESVATQRWKWQYGDITATNKVLLEMDEDLRTKHPDIPNSEYGQYMVDHLMEKYSKDPQVKDHLGYVKTYLQKQVNLAKTGRIFDPATMMQELSDAANNARGQIDTHASMDQQSQKIDSILGLMENAQTPEAEADTYEQPTTTTPPAVRP